MIPHEELKFGCFIGPQCLQSMEIAEKEEIRSLSPCTEGSSASRKLPRVDNGRRGNFKLGTNFSAIIGNHIG